MKLFFFVFDPEESSLLFSIFGLDKNVWITVIRVLKNKCIALDTWPVHS